MSARSITTAGLLVLSAAILGACSASGQSQSGNAPASVPTAAQQPSSAPEAPTTQPPAAKPAPAKPAPAKPAPATPKDHANADHTTGVARYQPSTIVTQSPSYTLLHTSDGVTRVSDFYAKQFSHGWTVVNKTLTAHSGSFTVRKSGHGANVVIAPMPSGASISISTY
jgi:hypothetical protein